jgi:hypothetical protein
MERLLCTEIVQLVIGNRPGKRVGGKGHRALCRPVIVHITHVYDDNADSRFRVRDIDLQ